MRSIVRFLARLQSSRNEQTSRKTRGKHIGETLAFDVTQKGNTVAVEGDEIAVNYAVEGIDLPLQADASFAVWALLAAAMEGGYNLHINRPIDPLVASNAQRLARIWEMWVPGLYRSVLVTGERPWRPTSRKRLPRVQLYSGGCDSTYSILTRSDPEQRGYVATVYGLDYRDNKQNEDLFGLLLSKTDPLLAALNYQRIVVRTNANRGPQKLTHGFTLASCLFLLSDLFIEGTLAADLTPPQDPLPFPWGTNHITNAYLAGSDFQVRTVDSEMGRTQKLAALAAGGTLPFLAFCRRTNKIPTNCGVCGKCIRTKAMLFAATGEVPEIFLDNTLDEQLMQKFDLKIDRAELFDLYGYAKDRGIVEAIPGLEDLVEKCRERSPDDPSL